MIYEFIANLQHEASLWWIEHFLPNWHIDFSGVYSSSAIPKLLEIKAHMNFFMGVELANFVVFAMTTGILAIMVIGLIKLIRYFMPVV